MDRHHFTDVQRMISRLHLVDNSAFEGNCGALDDGRLHDLRWQLLEPGLRELVGVPPGGIPAKPGSSGLFLRGETEDELSAILDALM